MNIAQTRLTSQHISDSNLQTPQDVVRSLGAMQAQDYGHSLWAVGLRMEQGRIEAVEKALQEGTIIRTWVMRGTIHLILAEDAKWMLHLLAKRVMARLTPKIWQYHGMDESAMLLAQKTLIKALSGGRHQTRTALIETLKQAGIPNDKQQSYFIFGYLSQNGLICPGPPQGRDQTFVLLDEWAPRQRKLSDDEALMVLAQRFLSGHGPATIADFANWAGIRISEAKQGLDGVKGSFVSETIGGVTYWLSPHTKESKGAFLLPGYDEYLIGYKDRSASFEVYGHTPISTYNGMFYATIVENGQVVGLWRRSIKEKSVDIELHPIIPFSPNRIAQHAISLETFYGKPVHIRIKEPLRVADTSKTFNTSRKQSNTYPENQG